MLGAGSALIVHSKNRSTLHKRITIFGLKTLKTNLSKTALYREVHTSMRGRTMRGLLACKNQYIHICNH